MKPWVLFSIRRKASLKLFSRQRPGSVFESAIIPILLVGPTSTSLNSKPLPSQISLQQTVNLQKFSFYNLTPCRSVNFSVIFLLCSPYKEAALWHITLRRLTSKKVHDFVSGGSIYPRVLSLLCRPTYKALTKCISPQSILQPIRAPHSDEPNDIS